MLQMIYKPPPPIRKVLVSIHKPPSCKTCKFYLEGGLCTAFATQEPVSGQVMYKNAVEVRDNSRMCGPEGKFWIKKYVFEMYPSLR